MENLAKIISSIIFLAIGIFVIYETIVLNLIEIIWLLGIIFVVVGITLLLSSFIDLSSIKNRTLDEVSSSNNKKSSPLKTPKNKKPKIKSKVKKPKFQSFTFETPDETKEVLDVKNYKESSFNDNQLYFTPNYEKPVRVTRKPKKRTEPYIDESEFYQNGFDKTEEIKKELSSSSNERIVNNDVEEDKTAPRNIKIDINNPESLPIPKELKNSIFSDNGTISSEEAFEDLAIKAKKDILLEIPNLNDLNDRFLSYVPTTKSRIIIEDFDISNTSYVLLISSLLSQDVSIRTLPKIDITNLVTDNLALIISEEFIENEGEYGAIYDNNSEISQIRAIFEKSWNLAKDIDKNLLKI